jgi:hypothetical protein
VTVRPKHSVVLYEDGWWRCLCGFVTQEDSEAQFHYQNTFYGGVEMRDSGVVSV